MLKNVIDLPSLFTAFTARGESLDDLKKLPELKGKKIVEMKQVHGDGASDATLTKDKKKALVVRAADCVPLLLYHEPSGTIGVIHAGRKGTELGVTEKTLKQLPSTEGPLHIWIGPHICEQCYQINPETNEHYNLLRQNLNQMYSVFEKSALRLNFESHCTAHNNDKFYSYRKEGEDVPMNYGVITLT